MRFAVVGSNGMFGSEMMAVLAEFDIKAKGFTRENLNLDSGVEEIAETLTGFDVVINAVAYTAVDKAEVELYEANTVNGIYPGLLAQAAGLNGARFIHISTDYVFEGLAANAYSVDAKVDPQTYYGKSKALGEQLVADSGADYSILRTAWLYGANGRCFPKVMKELLLKNGHVRVVGDQFGQPTWTRDLAEQVLKVVELEEMPKIVHAVASGKASWADFAKEVAISMGLNPEAAVEEISSQEFVTAAKRPAWSVLDNSSEVLEPIADWRERWKLAATSLLA